MSIQQAESIIMKSFRDEPFHTLYFLYNFTPLTHLFGGTCSDKVLSVKKQLEQANFSVQLHSSIIGNQECHRVLRLTINNREYFGDVGNGWPSAKLFPAFEDVTYNCYGITFNSKVFADHLKIYQTRDGVTKHTVTIPLKSKPEEQITYDISNRFDKSYPFSGKLRFAKIVDDKFLFIRDSELHIYANAGKQVLTGISENNLANILNQKFGFDLSCFLKFYTE